METSSCGGWRRNVRKVLRAAMVVLAVGCGRPTIKVDRCLELDPDPGVAAQLNLRIVSRSVEIARELFDAKTGIEGRFCAHADSLGPVRVLDGDFPCPITKGENCSGFYALPPENRIWVTKDGTALLHEFFHGEDLWKKKTGTAWHEGWDKAPEDCPFDVPFCKSYNELSDEFDRRMGRWNWSDEP